MSNDNDDATQLGSIRHHMNKPQQPGNPQARPAFQAPSLPTHPQEQSGDDEGTVLSAYNAMPYRPAMPTVPTTQPLKVQPAQPVQMRQPLPQSQPIPAAASPVKPAQPAATSSMMSAPQADITEFHNQFTKLVDSVSQVVVGKEQPIRQCATAMIVGGHILLEDNPGTGKTQLARGLANSIDMSFKRIQFTPDLLPSDVVGVTYYDQKNSEFDYREGPIFASVVLADEINRASPKTQSALLEVMEEQKVTVDGETHAVPQPFMVIATQNPIEQLGTYKLPEAQMDRFLIKTTIGYPSHDVSVSILKQVNVTDRASTVHAVLTGNDVLRMRAISETVHLDDAILEYIVRLVEATRHNERIQVGSSMRGALALTRCARVWAASNNRGYVVPDDVKQLAVAVLAHRITLTAEATFAGSTPELMIEQILENVPAPTVGVTA
ncbi:AAA family ATPase [Bifidobacterium catenulatum]|uniref:AAA family ATPase n=1 Tax=Bifidobacterium catenulatum TaxID=1686 RepID=UPI00232E6A95|nr:AAA family ATPase [Bifidobacterium catenulatum]MDB6910267.1 AAA family ATPase [Bifidobacterium catenulatum]